MEKTWGVHKSGLRNFKTILKEPLSNPYQDFWHFVLHKNEEIKRDGFTTLYVKEWIEDEDTPEFARVICGYLQKEFGEEIYCQTAW